MCIGLIKLNSGGKETFEERGAEWSELISSQRND